MVPAMATPEIPAAPEVTTAETAPALLRRGKDGHAFVTDGGHWILDVSFGRIADPRSLADRLDATTGVIEHGLFIGLAHTAVLAGPSGVRVVERS
jgi:ribose 5-phosphate isomerase A